MRKEAENWDQAEDMLSVMAITGRVDGEIQWTDEEELDEPPTWMLWGMTSGEA